MAENIEMMDENSTDTELVETTKKKPFSNVLKKIGDIIGKIGVKNFVIAGSFLIIGLTVILNFVLFGNTTPIVSDGDALGAGIEENADAQQQEEAYFASAQLSRKQARDQAIAVLQTVVESSTADATTREQASNDISRIASEIQVEANIETLIKSKGFEECVAVVSEGSASIIVRSDGLLPNELSQIKEIVYEQAGIDPVYIKIIEQSST